MNDAQAWDAMKKRMKWIKSRGRARVNALDFITCGVPPAQAARLCDKYLKPIDD